MINQAKRNHFLRSSVAFVLVFTMASVSLMANGRQHISHGGSDRDRTGLSDLITSVKSSPRMATQIERREGSPLTIIDSSAWEISRNTYRKLTSRAAGFNAVSYPRITVANTSDQEINQITFVVSDVPTRQHSFITVKNLNVAPGEVYVAETEKLMRAGYQPAVRERLSGPQKFLVPANEAPGFDSNKVWMPGSAADLSVTVGYVGFSNGSKWDCREHQIVSRNIKGGGLSPALATAGVRPRTVGYSPTAAADAICLCVVFSDDPSTCYFISLCDNLDDCIICALICCGVLFAITAQ